MLLEGQYKSALIMRGALCAMSCGRYMMLTLCVVNLDIQIQVRDDYK